MANGNDLFDDDSKQQNKPGQGQGEQQAGGGGPGGPVSRRKFLVGAGVAAAAGAAVGAGAVAGIAVMGDDDEEAAEADGAVAEAGGVTIGAPDGKAVSQAVVKFNVNGKDQWVTVAAHQSLAEVLRENLGLTGTKVSCDRSECSACTVLIDGVPHNSCSLLAIREGGTKIVTIEGLEQGTKLSAVQQAFLDNMGLQCGFCTPGIILQTTALLQTNPQPTEADIRHALAGNLCKCAAYPFILASVQAAAKATAG